VEAPKPTAPPAAGKSLLAGSISIAAAAPVKTAMPKLQAEVRQLTQEDLERYWNEVAMELQLGELMKDATVKLGEQHGTIEVDAQTTYFHDEFKPHKTEVLEALRAKTGMRMLDCKVNQLFVDKDEVIYSPDEKYKAMLQEHPAMMAMRKLFPNIDF
jgi:hypothetical protein